MKKIFMVAMSMVIATAQFTGSALDIKGLLGGLGGKESAASAVTDLIGNLISSDKIEISQIQGTWTYTDPAVSFKSDNLLKKAGGAAAAEMVEKKIAPYYKTVGFNSMVLTINADSTFTMKLKRLTLKGRIEKVTDKKSQANFVFNFQVAGKMNIGRLDTYITCQPAMGTMNVMFDVSKLLTLVEKVGAFTGNSTIKGLSGLLGSYDGMCAGFALKKTGK